MRVLYAGGWATGSGSSALRNQAIYAALQDAGLTVVPPPEGGEPQPTRLLGVAKQKYLFNEHLADLVRSARPDVVITYPNLGNLQVASAVAADLGIPVVADLADWYDWRHVPRTSTAQWALNEVAVRKARTRLQGVITPSRYLSDYFTAPAIVLSALFESAPTPASIMPRDHRPRVAYVGQVAAKDDLAVRHLLEALLHLDPRGDTYDAHIVGAGMEQVRRLLPRGAQMPRGVVVHGRVPRQEAVDILASADVSLVQRDPRPRYARAGFPSKVAESLLLGTAVMGNLSSDLDEYLVNGVNALVLDGWDLASMQRGLEQLTETTFEWSRDQIADDAAQHFVAANQARRLGDWLRDVARS